MRTNDETDLSEVGRAFDVFYQAAKEQRKIEDRKLKVSKDDDQDIFLNHIAGKTAMRWKLGIRLGINEEENTTTLRSYRDGFLPIISGGSARKSG